MPAREETEPEPGCPLSPGPRDGDGLLNKPASFCATVLFFH
jgi:hypothetical protein